MIKGSVYVFIFDMYTHDKDIITETLSETIFIRAPNEKNREYMCRKGDVRARKGSRESWRQRGGSGQTAKVLVPKSLQFLSMTGLRIKTFPARSDNQFVVMPPLPIGVRAM